MYEFSVPTRVVFGQGVIERAAQNIAELKKTFPSSCIIVTMGEGWAWKVAVKIKKQLIKAGGKKVEIFDQIDPNPTRACTQKGVNFSRGYRNQVIVGLGGGSSMDAAKVIAKEAEVDMLVTVPTTAGTGGEVSPWAVITNKQTREKESIVAKTPDLALLDPALTVSMPPSLTLFTGTDAFSHAVEAYMSKRANPLTDALSFKALGLIKENLPGAVEEDRNIKARQKMLEGSLLAGIAMLHTGLGLIHAIANTLGGMYHHLSHGQIIVPLLRRVSEFNGAANHHKFTQIKRYIDKIEKYIQEAERQGIKRKPVFIKQEDVGLLVERTLNNINAATNPRDFTYEDVKRITMESFS